MAESKKKKIIWVLIALLFLLVVIAVLAGIKALQIREMVQAGESFVPPPETVTAATAEMTAWENLLTAVGSLEAVQGVTVAAELSGKVVKIAFTPGEKVSEGDLLLQQDLSSEQARLPGAVAALQLAKRNRDRLSSLLKQKMVSQAEFDSADAAYRQADAEVRNIRAAMEKKTIRAPFGGRLGIRQVDLGQILQEGDPIVSLQTLNPIFVNFLLPQRYVGSISVGMPVRIIIDALPGETLEGQITTINPELETATRNVRVQATLKNSQERLRPAMFVNVEVVLPQKQEVLVVPATAILYAPYGNSVFVVEEIKDKSGGADGKVLRQQFVRLGGVRGDFVAVEEGLQPGETVVSTGVFKLRNGQAVVVDNTMEPEFQLEPRPENQ